MTQNQKELAPSDTHSAAAVIMLPAIIDLPYAPSLHQQVIEALAASPTLDVDGSAVERASTPCIQVLLAAARQAEKTGRAFYVRRPSSILIEALETLGLRGDLEPWMGQP